VTDLRVGLSFHPGADDPGAAPESPVRPESESCTRAHVSFGGARDVPGLVGDYLGPTEQPVFESMTGHRRVPWLLGRVAAKDAVRRHLLGQGFADIDPSRILVDNDANGCPRIRVQGARLATRGVQVSIAHKPAVAVAVAATFRVRPTPAGGPGRPAAGIGIDVEAVEPRSPSFERTVLTPAERTMEPGTDEGRDRWLTRLWAVKEAVAKSTGLGLGGRPKDFEVDGVDGERLHCRGRWIATEPLDTLGGHFIVAWTDSY
jgi:phosphopantetheinyl transferase (holo-ACP synthase)